MEDPVVAAVADAAAATKAAAAQAKFMVSQAKTRAKTQNQIIARLEKVAPKKVENGVYEVVRSVTVIPSAVKYILTLGNRAFDDLIGGLPFGRVVELFGEENCGKSAMAIRAAVRAQQGHIYERQNLPDGTWTLKPVDQHSYHITVLYIDNEQSLDEDRKRVDGTLLDCLIARCETIEQIFKMMEETINTLCKIEEETGVTQFLVVVVDTIAGTPSKEELAEEWGKDDYSRQPKQLRAAFRKMIQSINKHNVCMICTNQVSDKFTAKPKFKTSIYEDFVAFGGKALRYYATHRIFFKQLPNRFALSKKSPFHDGFVIAFASPKNRLKKPCREGRMVLWFGDSAKGIDGGFTDTYSMLETLVYLGFAEYDEGTWVFRFKRNRIPVTTFGAVPEDKIGAALEADDEAATPTRPLRKKAYADPRITERWQWPDYYLAHKADFDAMWAAAMKFSFALEVQSQLVDEDPEDDENSVPKINE